MFTKEYTIKYIDVNSQELEASIIASSKDEALRKLCIQETNFISASVKYNLNRGIPINVQLQILTRVAGGVLSGETIKQYLPSIVDDFRALKDNKALVLHEIEKGKTLSELLSYLNINPLCVKIIKNGEQSGTLADSIKDARQVLKLEDKTRSSTSSVFLSQLVYLITAFTLIFGGSSFVVYFYQDMESNGLSIDHTMSTDIIFFINDFNIYGLTILIAAAVAIALRLELFLKKFGRIYPISIFQNIITTKASILFLSIFIPLFKTGMKTQQILASYSTIHHANANKLQQQIEQGLSIEQSVQNLEFSNTFKSGFKGFDRISNTQAKLAMLSELFDGLISDLETYSKQAGKLIAFIVQSLIWGAVLLAIDGFMLPQLSMGVAI